MNTLKELFNQLFKLDEIFFHIPHSNSYIPSYKGYDLTLIDEEINLTTDWYTDQIFDIRVVDKLITPFSRVFCDVERLPDDRESMLSIGRGFFYTSTVNGKLLRTDVNNLKETIYKNYYLDHHKKLNSLTKDKLEKYDRCLLIDCHSFNDLPIPTDSSQDEYRPDICIGYNNHTDMYLLNYFTAFFESHNFNVEVNYPYYGAMIPSDYEDKDYRVKSIMIEINKGLYMNPDLSPIPNRITYLREIISHLIFCLIN